MPPGGQATHEFATPANLTPYDTVVYHVVFEITDPRDFVPMNNILGRQVLSFPTTTTYPFLETFDTYTGSGFGGFGGSTFDHGGWWGVSNPDLQDFHPGDDGGWDAVSATGFWQDTGPRQDHTTGVTGVGL